MGVGSIMQQHGDIDPALDKYALVANSAPESPYMWNNLGMCYNAKAQWATVSQPIYWEAYAQYLSLKEIESARAVKWLFSYICKT